jgi:GNAT superfamily N-acetyltransferase
LAALGDSPYAFGSTLAEEAIKPPTWWRRRLAERVQFVARLGDEVAGTAGGVAADDGRVAELVFMWVQPSARGQGVGDGLVAAVLDWAAHHGYGQVRLWVSLGNNEAERLYARHGFQTTGADQPVVAGEPARLEFEMVRVICGFPSSGAH